MNATLEAAPTSVRDTTAPSPANASAGRPLRLTTSAAAAAKRVGPWVAKGSAVRKRRVRDRGDLDAARAERTAWVRGYADALREVFDGPAVADACTEWAGRILPEYAPVGLFVEQFYEEMDHRLRRLQAVVDHLDDLAAEESTAGTRTTSGTASTANGTTGGGGGARRGSTHAPRDEHKGRSMNWARLFPTAGELGGASSSSLLSAAVQADEPSPATAAAPIAAAAATAVAAVGTTDGLSTVVKPVGLLLVSSADQATAVGQFLSDLAVTPRVVVAAGDTDAADLAGAADVEALTADPTPPAFALVWPPAERPAATDRAALAFQFRLGFLVGRLGSARVCLVASPGVAVGGSPVATVAIDAHDGWQLPLARTLKRAGVQVDLNRLC